MAWWRAQWAVHRLCVSNQGCSKVSGGNTGELSQKHLGFLTHLSLSLFIVVEYCETFFIPNFSVLHVY